MKSKVLLAPNGKPSNLTPEQYKLVRTKAFKDWFGDWEKSPKNSSKVIDKNGEPLVVYHGSIKKTFNKFDKKKQGNYVAREFVVGFYFSNNPLIAETYTYEPYKEKFLGKNFVRQFFLNIRRINTIDCENSGWEPDYDDVIFESEDNYDGVKLKNIFDIFGDKLPNTKLEDYKGDTYAIYNPKNIKLADGTNTTFDTKNADIRFGGGGTFKDINSKKSNKMSNLEYCVAVVKFGGGIEKETEVMPKAMMNEWVKRYIKEPYTCEVYTCEPDGKKIKKMSLGGDIGKENLQMVLNNNKQIAHHTEELKEAIKGKNVPTWVVAKVNRAASDLSDATHYLDGVENDKMGLGGGIDNERLMMDLKDIKLKYPKAKVSYNFAKDKSGKGYVITAKENGKVVYSSYKMATGGNIGIGSEITFFDKYYDKNRAGTIVSEINKDEYEVGTSIGTKLVNKKDIIGLAQKEEKKSWWQFKQGGRLDLFEDYDNIPPKIKEILDQYEEDFEDGNYKGLAEALKLVRKNGYTFEYYLDGQAYGLRPKNVPLSELKGYEQMEKGGGVGVTQSKDGNYYIYPDGAKKTTMGVQLKNGGELAKYDDLSELKPMVINDSEPKKSNKKPQGVIDEIDITIVRKGVELKTKQVTSSRDVFAIFKELWSTERLSVNEDCNVLFLNQNNRVVSYYQHSKGGINQTTIDIEMVCALAIKCLAKGVIVAHNHPSENLRPSEADSNFTRKLKTALALFSVNLLDSLIITKDSYFSFADDGLMKRGGTLKIAEKKYLKDKVKKVISEFNLGKLKTSAGKKVTDVKQALAIGYSEAKAGWKHKKQKRK